MSARSRSSMPSSEHWRTWCRHRSARRSVSRRDALDPVRHRSVRVVWPVTIGMARGYQRLWSGVGSDELRAVLRAAVRHRRRGRLPGRVCSQHALLKLVVVATPLALALSLTDPLRGAQDPAPPAAASAATSAMSWSSAAPAAAQQLRERLDREPHCGMKVIGVCLPRTRHGPRGRHLGMPVLGDLREVADVVRRMDCDAVAVTSDDATRYNYLRELVLVAGGHRRRDAGRPRPGRGRRAHGCTSGR